MVFIRIKPPKRFDRRWSAFSLGKNFGYSVMQGFQPSPLRIGLTVMILAAGVLVVYSGWRMKDVYTFRLQSPIWFQLRGPLVVFRRVKPLAVPSTGAAAARHDHTVPITTNEQYVCQEFGSSCRVALAVQRAENPQGKCEIYHHNADGTLDWGYFQINSVHLKRRKVSLGDLLDCKTNIDFAFQLYTENHGFTPWASYNTGRYRRYLQR
jgi:hypothetical protein